MPSENELIRVAVLGAAGRMGREVLRALTPQYGFKILVAVDRSCVGEHCRQLAGPEAPDLAVKDKLGAALDQSEVDVLVDFSHHSGAASHATSAMKRGVSPVIGCTGLSEADMGEIRSLTKELSVPAMYVPNFAIGAVLMMKFSQLAARWMPDAEIIELHHDRKEDAPSGTAILTAQLISESRTSDPVRLPRQVIKAEGARGGKVCDIPVHSVRLPGFLAHQQVIFGAPGEVLTLRHDSSDRQSFMQGVRLAAGTVKSLQGFVVGLDKILFRDA
jgi:4-hydroxy-tetrahydrodipicolinate reductase